MKRLLLAAAILLLVASSLAEVSVHSGDDGIGRADADTVTDKKASF